MKMDFLACQKRLRRKPVTSISGALYESGLQAGVPGVRRCG